MYVRTYVYGVYALRIKMDQLTCSNTCQVWHMLIKSLKEIYSFNGDLCLIKIWFCISYLTCTAI